MPTIEVSPHTFIRLQKHAVALVDTIDTVLNRILDVYEAGEDGGGSTVKPEPKTFNPLAPPDLTHTKVLATEIGHGRLQVQGATWSGVMMALIREAKARAANSDELRRLITIPFVEGRRLGEGYRYHPDLGLSTQGQDANGAWRAACHLAQALDIPVEVDFAWRTKEGAAFPGEMGNMAIHSKHKTE